MDYFNDLLTSYSLLKKRKLKLLVENDRPTAEAKANQLVKDAANKASNQPAIGEGPRYKIGAYKKADTGEIKFGKLGADGKVSGWQKSASTDMETLIGMFLSDETKDPDYGKKPPDTKGAEAGQTALGILGPESPDLAFDISQDFMEIGAIMGSDFNKKLSKKAWDFFLKKYGDMTSKRFGNYIFGATSQSLELQIASKVSRMVKVGDNYAEIPEPLDVVTRKEVTTNLLKLVRLISKRGGKDDATTEIQKFISSKFGIGTDGSVTVFTSLVSEEGVVFKDTQGTLKLLLETLSEMAGAKPKNMPIVEDRTKNVGESNNLRGTLLEEILPLVSVMGMNARMALNHPNKGAMDKSVKSIYEKLKGKLVKFAQLSEAWTIKFENTVMLPEEKEMYDELMSYTGVEAANSLKALFAVSKSALRDRGADFFIPVGKATGNGRKSDILECYTDLNKVTAVYNKLGIQNPLESGFIGSSTLNILGASKLLSDEMKDALMAQGIGPDTIIFAPETSLKNYKELKEVKAGTMRSGSFNKFIRGEEKEQDFLQSGLKELGLTDTKSLIAYHEKLDQIYSDVTTLGPATSKSATGKEVSFNSFKGVTQSAAELITKNSSYHELFGAESEKNIEAQLLTDLQGYNESSGEWSKNPMVMDKIKHNLVTYLKNKRIEKDLSSGSPLEQESARNYVLMKLWGSGGSASKGMMMDARGLDKNENYVIHQNQVISEIIQSVKSGKGPWTLNLTGNHYHFIRDDKIKDVDKNRIKDKNRDTRPRVSLADKVAARQGEDRYSTTSIVHFNNDTLREYDRKNQP